MRFDIHFKHRPPSEISDVEQAVLGCLGIRVGDRELFRLDDKARNVAVDVILTSAYPLALWFAANWWRLRYEPARKSIDWRMSHELQSSGGGYLWPRIIFASDGEEIDIQCRPLRATAHEPVEFLCRDHLKVSVCDFESGLDRFLSKVLRLAEEAKFCESELHAIWTDVLAERNDPQKAKLRRLEALIGCDPDEAPRETIEQLTKFFDDEGQEVTEEIAAASGLEAAHAIEEIELLREHASQINLATISDFPRARRSARRGIKGGRATEINANDVARRLRGFWSLEPGPLSLARQAELFSLPMNLLEDRTDPRGPFAIGFRSGEGAGQLRPILHFRHHTSRRFSLARMIGDAMNVDPKEGLLPITQSGTNRQKFQRAFAQEFLCPIEDLKSFLGTEKPDGEAIEEAALHFDVSTTVVRFALVNHGVMDRDELPI